MGLPCFYGGGGFCGDDWFGCGWYDSCSRAGRRRGLNLERQLAMGAIECSNTSKKECGDVRAGRSWAPQCTCPRNFGRGRGCPTRWRSCPCTACHEPSREDVKAKGVEGGENGTFFLKAVMASPRDNGPSSLDCPTSPRRPQRVLT
jgi:hypothetical protein